MKNVRFTKVDNVRVPIKLDLAYSRIYPGINFFDNTKIHQKVIDIILNPDHDALGSFFPDDIQNGARVTLRGVEGIYYRWQDGQVVDEQGRVLLDPGSEKPVSAESESKAR